MTDGIAATKAKDVPLVAMRVALAAAATFVVLLALLHVIEPEFDPSWRFISEYQLGRYGLVMSLAFLLLATSYIALFVALWPQLQNILGRVGLASLLLSAAGLVLGAIFTTDPIIAAPDELTFHGAVHNFGGTVGLAMPLAAALVTWKLTSDPAWSMSRRWLWWTGAMAVLCTGGFILFTLAALPPDGKFGPNVSVGWPNRIEILAYVIWLMAVAWQAMLVRKRTKHFQ